MFNFEHLDILCAWIGHPSEKLWPFDFLETFRCKISSDSICYSPELDIRVKRYGCLNLHCASIFNFELLDILCVWIGIQVKSYHHINFSTSSVVQFRASQYIIGLNWTFVSKVMAVRICLVLSRFISSVSIHYAPKSDIWVNSYHHLNFSRASVVQFQASRYIIGLNRTS